MIAVESAGAMWPPTRQEKYANDADHNAYLEREAGGIYIVGAGKDMEVTSQASSSSWEPEPDEEAVDEDRGLDPAPRIERRFSSGSRRLSGSAALARERDRLLEKLDCAGDEVDSLQRERDDAVHRLGELERRLSREERLEKSTSLEDKLSALQAERDAALSRGHAAEERLRRLSRQEDGNGSDNLQHRLAAAEEHSSELQKENLRLRQRLRDSENELGVSQERVQDLQSQLAQQQQMYVEVQRAAADEARAQAELISALQTQAAEAESRAEDADFAEHRWRLFCTDFRARWTRFMRRRSSILLEVTPLFHAWHRSVSSGGRPQMQSVQSKDEEIAPGIPAPVALTGPEVQDAERFNISTPDRSPPSSPRMVAVGNDITELIQQAATIRSEVAQLVAARRARVAKTKEIIRNAAAKQARDSDKACNTQPIAQSVGGSCVLNATNIDRCDSTGAPLLRPSSSQQERSRRPSLNGVQWRWPVTVAVASGRMAVATGRWIWTSGEHEACGRVALVASLLGRPPSLSSDVCDRLAEMLPLLLQASCFGAWGYLAAMRQKPREQAQGCSNLAQSSVEQLARRQSVQLLRHDLCEGRRAVAAKRRAEERNKSS